MKKPVWPLVVTYLILLAIAIPWYWPAHDQKTLLGLPRWVVVSIITSVLISCFSAWIFMCRWPVDDEDGPEEDA